MSTLRFCDQRLIAAQSLVTVLARPDALRTVGTSMEQIYDVCVRHGLVVEAVQAQQDESGRMLALTCRLVHTTDVLQALEELHEMQRAQACSICHDLSITSGREKRQLLLHYECTNVCEG